MVKTHPLVLDAMIVTGNTKAAIKAAGGGSSDLWTVPPDQIHYDPRDNVRPLDPTRVRKVADSIKANGYDRKKPLGCFVRKVGGEDRIFVYEGQHRYHGALLAISEGTVIERLPLVIDDAKSVTRSNLIYAGIINNDGEKLTPLQLAEKIVELQALGEDNATICARLTITEQTIRDCLLLANAPAAVHKLVRDNAVASTLAIEEIRAHGGEKALERLQKGLVDAKAAGKTKVTKKHLGKPIAGIAQKKITEVQAKQLLQALQSVLHDPLFGKLSPGTIAGVHAALTPLTDLLDALPTKAKHRKISTPNEHGVYTRHETIKAPLFKRSGKYPYEIHLAHVATGQWIFSTSYSIGNGSGSSPCVLRDGDPTYPTRGQAIRAAVMHITREMEDPRKRNAKEAPGIHSWLTRLWQTLDPDWTEEMAAEVAK
ncbi:ParB/RepB/Spo0J family partition protein [Paraburkholderia caribensis]|uniref:ParB/RepB/Spo0J family partition protein n=1 Tax=Paraburkholderia caribensis TaxID=75105 RepID=UPI0007213ACB|nr:ParB N-terminal domain-containing protein [Paraburkholderia caribensis]ALP62374.1 transcriptional regulator [Paraburkholderia caribensis]AUT52398.1 transcriptional regulator [Paraburkholderia caribensis]